MKLSDIVSFKNLLDTLSTKSQAHELLDEMLSIIHTTQSNEVQIDKAVEQLTQAREQVSQAVVQFEYQFEQLKLQVQNLI